MKILVIDEEFPYPLNSGKRIRSFHLLTRLAARNNIRYLAYGKAPSEGFAMLLQRGINPVAVTARVPRKSGSIFYLRLLLNLFSSYPYIVSSHYSKSFEQAFNKEVREFAPDLTVVQNSGR